MLRSAAALSCKQASRRKRAHGTSILLSDALLFCSAHAMAHLPSLAARPPSCTLHGKADQKTNDVTIRAVLRFTNYTASYTRSMTHRNCSTVPSTSVVLHKPCSLLATTRPMVTESIDTISCAFGDAVDGAESTNSRGLRGFHALWSGNRVVRYEICGN